MNKGANVNKVDNKVVYVNNDDLVFKSRLAGEYVNPAIVHNMSNNARQAEVSLSPTIIFPLLDEEENCYRVRTLLDPGSGTNWITRDLLSKVSHREVGSEVLEVVTFSNTVKRKFQLVEVYYSNLCREKLALRCYVIDDYTRHIAVKGMLSHIATNSPESHEMFKYMVDPASSDIDHKINPGIGMILCSSSINKIRNKEQTVIIPSLNILLEPTIFGVAVSGEIPLVLKHHVEIIQANNSIAMIVKEKEAIIKEKETIIKEKEAKIQSLQLKMEQSNRENAELRQANFQKSQEDSALREEILKLQRENESVTKDLNDNKLALKNLQIEKDTLFKEKTEALARLTSCNKHREQMITTIEKQHQENLTYHAEIQRLSQSFQQEVQKSNQEQATLNNSADKKALAEALKALTEAAGKEVQLKEEIKELMQKNENLKMEITESRCNGNSLEEENDMPRVVNAQFYAVYQQKSKELKEIRGREFSLKTTLRKMDEKLDHL